MVVSGFNHNTFSLQEVAELKKLIHALRAKVKLCEAKMRAGTFVRIVIHTHARARARAHAHAHTHTHTHTHTHICTCTKHTHKYTIGNT